MGLPRQAGSGFASNCRLVWPPATSGSTSGSANAGEAAVATIVAPKAAAARPAARRRIFKMDFLPRFETHPKTEHVNANDA
ncbi:hypothetical protein GCM10022419_043950 [Nonomuraea rosea]|uniref:Uncharacterized protein n=1 Tax=Nonomuraea rosea TaxID=638574 RepID=A0ABP6WY59_9ACTN